MAWGSRLGILSERADNVARTLKPAHDELLNRSYVTEVEITGRGRDKLVRYVFGPPPVGEHPELAALLSSRGVKQGVAVRLSTVFPERIKEAARRFDHYMKISTRPVGNPGGLLVSIVQRPEDFADLPGYAHGAAPVSHAIAPPPRRPAPPEDESAADAREAARIAALAGQDLVDWVLRQLSLLGTLKHFTVAERTRLAEALLMGELDGRTLVHEAIRAVGAGLLPCSKWSTMSGNTSRPSARSF